MTRKEFYNTKGWKKNRVAYAISKHCICERCGRPVYVSGINETLPKEKRLRYIVHHKEHLNDSNFSDPKIAYDWNNLELLCIDCHTQEHLELPTREGLMFDQGGNLVERIQINRQEGEIKNPPGID